MADANWRKSRLHVDSGFADRALAEKKDIHGDFVFGAFAELIDNAMEAGSKRIKIQLDDVFRVLRFSDDGMSIDRRSAIRLIAQGRTEKGRILQAPGYEGDSVSIIENFGVGFKSGMTRIGKDAIVLFKSFECTCDRWRRPAGADDSEKLACFEGRCQGTKLPLRGLIFYSRRLNASVKDRFIVPIIFWRADGTPLTSDSCELIEAKDGSETDIIENDEIRGILKMVYENSHCLSAFGAVKQEFQKIDTEYGTRILITGLRETGDGDLQVFKVDEDTQEDICIAMQKDKKYFQRRDRAGFPFRGDIPIDWSLRAYCELLYLGGKMKIYIQGVRVKSTSFEDCLKFSEGSVQHYTLHLKRNLTSSEKPAHAENFPIEKEMDLVLGFSPAAYKRGLCGMFFYFQNNLDDGSKIKRLYPSRLILSYSKCCSPFTNYHGLTDGMVGMIVIESPLLKIYNGKQKFDPELTRSTQEELDNEIEKAALTYYSSRLFKTAVQQVKDRLKCQEQRGIFEGSICWARWNWKQYKSDRLMGGEHWPGQVMDTDDLEQMRKVPAKVLEERAAFSKERKSNDLHLIWLFCEEENPYIWCVADDIEEFPSADNQIAYVAERSKILKDLGQGTADSFVEAIKFAEAQCKTFIDDRFEIDKFCRGCLRSVKVLSHMSVEHDMHSEFVCKECELGKKKVDDGIFSVLSTPNSKCLELNISDYLKEGTERIGQGSHGTVYKVIVEGSKRAVKVFSTFGSDRNENAKICKQFDKEVLSISMLRHDNIIRFYGKETKAGGNPAIMMEFCEFEDMVGDTQISLTNLREAIEHEHLDSQSCFDFIVFVQLAIDISQGMKYIHGRDPSILHRDLKPENILISNGKHYPCAKICDFSWSKLGSEISHVSSAEPTPSIYKAPDCSGLLQPPINFLKSADVYSFGWVLLEMLAGKLSSWRKLVKKAENGILDKIRKGDRDQELYEVVFLRNEKAALLINECFHNEWCSRPDFGQILEKLMKIKEEESHKLDNVPFRESTESVFDYTRRQKADNHIVWRVLDDRDIFIFSQKQILRPREIHNRVQSFSCNSLLAHVDHGSTAEALDQIYISTSKDIEWIFWYIRKKLFYHRTEHPLKRNKCCFFYPFVEIDLLKCPEVRIIDLSDKQRCSKFFSSMPVDLRRNFSKAENFAVDAAEVILLGNIPRVAIKGYQIETKAPPGKASTHQGQNFEGIRPIGALNTEFEKFSLWKSAFQKSSAVWRTRDKQDSFMKECFEAARANKALWPYPDSEAKQSILEEFSLKSEEALKISKRFSKYCGNKVSTDADKVKVIMNLRKLFDILERPDACWQTLRESKLENVVKDLAGKCPRDNARLDTKIKNLATQWLKVMKVIEVSSSLALAGTGGSAGQYSRAEKRAATTLDEATAPKKPSHAAAALKEANQSATACKESEIACKEGKSSKAKGPGVADSKGATASKESRKGFAAQEVTASKEASRAAASSRDLSQFAGIAAALREEKNPSRTASALKETSLTAAASQKSTASNETSHTAASGSKEATASKEVSRSSATFNTSKGSPSAGASKESTAAFKKATETSNRASAASQETNQSATACKEGKSSKAKSPGEAIAPKVATVSQESRQVFAAQEVTASTEASRAAASSRDLIQFAGIAAALREEKNPSRTASALKETSLSAAASQKSTASKETSHTAASGSKEATASKEVSRSSAIFNTSKGSPSAEASKESTSSKSMGANRAAAAFKKATDSSNRASAASQETNQSSAPAKETSQSAGTSIESLAAGGSKVVAFLKVANQAASTGSTSQQSKETIRLQLQGGGGVIGGGTGGGSLGLDLSARENECDLPVGSLELLQMLIDNAPPGLFARGEGGGGAPPPPPPPAPSPPAALLPAAAGNASIAWRPPLALPNLARASLLASCFGGAAGPSNEACLSAFRSIETSTLVPMEPNSSPQNSEQKPDRVQQFVLPLKRTSAEINGNDRISASSNVLCSSEG